jgi:ABC-type amino acid transport substrate-binding protein
MKKISLLFIFLCLFSCDRMRGTTYTVGIDTHFVPENLYDQRLHILGFLQELLGEISKTEKIHFDIQYINYDDLQNSLQTKKVDSIISILPPYNFYEAKYDFSKEMYYLGPVLVVPKNAKEDSLQNLQGKVVGTIAGDLSAISILQKYPHILSFSYENPAVLFEALEQQQIHALIIDHLPAIAFLREFYFSSMKISQAHLGEEAIRFIVLKNEHVQLLRVIDQFLLKRRHSKKMQALKHKWQLACL